MSTDQEVRIRLRTTAEGAQVYDRQISQLQSIGTTAQFSSAQLAALGGHATASSARMTAGMSASASAAQILARATHAATGDMAAGMASAATAAQNSAAAQAQAFAGMTQRNRASMQSMTESMMLSLHNIDATLLQLNQRMQSTASGSTSLTNSANAQSGAVNNLAGDIKNLVAAYVGWQGIKSTANTADDMQLLAARIKNATNSTEDYNHATTELVQVSLDTHSALAANDQLFASTNKSIEALGGNVDTTIALTKLMSQGLSASGTSAASSSALITQFTQSIQSNLLRGDEFNSFMENGSVLVDQLTVALGKNKGELRAMAEAGELSAAVVINALLSRADAIDKMAHNMPLTIGRALEDTHTKWSIYINDVNNATGATQTVAHSIESIGDNLQPIIGAATGLGLVATAIWGINAATLAWNATLRINPLFALASIGAGAIGYVIGEINKAKSDYANFMASANSLDEQNLKIKQQIAKINAIDISNKNSATYAVNKAKYDEEVTSYKILVDERNALARTEESKKIKLLDESAAKASAIDRDQLTVRKANVDSALQYIKIASDHEILLVDEKIHRLNSLYELGQVSVKDYFEQNAALIKERGAQEASAIQQQLDIVKQQIKRFESDMPILTATVKLDSADMASKLGTALSAATQKFGKDFNAIFDAAAKRTGVDVNLLKANTYVESGFNPNARSAAGAVGVAQLMPDTAARFGVKDRTDIEQSINAMADYFKYLVGLFGNNKQLMIAAYNAGEGAVQKYHNQIPPYSETVNHVAKVSAAMGMATNKEDAAAQTEYNKSKIEAIKLENELAAAHSKTSLAVSDSDDKLKKLINDTAKHGQTAAESAQQELNALRELKAASNGAISDTLFEKLQANILYKAEVAASQAVTPTEQYNRALLELQHTAANVSISEDGLRIKNTEIGLQYIANAERIGKMTSAYEGYQAAVNAAGIALLDKKIDVPTYNTAVTKLGNDFNKEAIDAANKSAKDYQSHLDNINKSTQQIGATNSAIFDGALGGINAMVNAFDNATTSIQKFAEEQKKLDEERASNAQTAQSEADYYKASKNLDAQSVRAKLDGARQVSAAVESMFAKGSTAQRAAHAVTMAIAGAEMAQTILKLTGIGAVTAAETASVAPTVAASTIKGEAKAAEAVATQASAGPYIGFALMAAMAAAMAAIGFATGGGGGTEVDYAKLTQEKTGTGSVLGDSSAKSESIAKNIEYLKQNSDASLPISSAMLTALQNIESGIGGIAGYGAAHGWFSLNSANKGVSIGEISFTRDKSIADFGITSNYARNGAEKDPLATANRADNFIDRGQTVADILRAGLDIARYTDTKVVEDYFFGSSTRYHREDNTVITGDIKNQFSLAIKGGAESIELAAKSLGMHAATLDDTVNNFVFRLGDISFKGTDGKDRPAADIQKDIDAAFSKNFDLLAQQAAPDIAAFQKVGEGYYQTLVRVSSGMEQAQAAANSLQLGKIGDIYSISNAQGDIALEALRAAILKVETASNGSFSSLGLIIKDFQGSLSDEASLYKTLTTIRNQFVAGGLDATAVSSASINSAGSLDALKTGSQAYFEQILSGSEQQTAKFNLLSDSFAKLGKSLPATNNDFRLLVQSIDGTSEAGQRLIGQLMSLTPQFVELTDLTDKLRRAQQQQAAQFADLMGDKATSLLIQRQLSLESVDPSLRKDANLIDFWTQAKDVIAEFNTINLTATDKNIQIAQQWYDDKFARIVANWSDGTLTTAESISSLSVVLQVFQNRINSLTADIDKANQKTIANYGKSSTVNDVQALLDKYANQQISINTTDSASKQQAQAAYDAAMAGVGAVKDSINSWLAQFSNDARTGRLQAIIANMHSSSDLSGVSNFMQANLQSADFQAWFSQYNAQIMGFDTQLHSVFNALDTAVAKYGITVNSEQGANNTGAMWADLLNYFKGIKADSSTLQKSDFQNALDGVTQYVKDWTDAINLAASTAINMANSASDKANIATTAQVYRDQLAQVQQAKNDAIFKQYRQPLETQIYTLSHSKADALAYTRQLELSAMDESLRPLQQMVNALTDMRDAATKTQDAISSATTSLTDLIDRLKNATTGNSDYAQAKVLLQTTLDQAKAGNFEGIDKSVQNLSALSSDQSKLFATAADYRREQAANIATLQIIKDLAANKSATLDTIALPGMSNTAPIVAPSLPIDYSGPTNPVGTSVNLLSYNDLIQEIKNLRQDYKDAQVELKSANDKIVQYTKVIADLAERDEVIGPMPPRSV